MTTRNKIISCGHGKILVQIMLKFNRILSIIYGNRSRLGINPDQASIN